MHCCGWPFNPLGCVQSNYTDCLGEGGDSRTDNGTYSGSNNVSTNDYHTDDHTDDCNANNVTDDCNANNVSTNDYHTDDCNANAGAVHHTARRSLFIRLPISSVWHHERRQCLRGGVQCIGVVLIYGFLPKWDNRVRIEEPEQMRSVQYVCLSHGPSRLYDLF